MGMTKAGTGLRPSKTVRTAVGAEEEQQEGGGVPSIHEAVQCVPDAVEEANDSDGEEHGAEGRGGGRGNRLPSIDGRSSRGHKHTVQEQRGSMAHIRQQNTPRTHHNHKQRKHKMQHRRDPK